MMPAIVFTIRYNSDHEEDALALARRLFALYDTGIDSLSLIPTQDEHFALYFNEQLVASQQRDGRAPAVADARALFRAEGISVTPRPVLMKAWTNSS